MSHSSVCEQVEGTDDVQEGTSLNRTLKFLTQAIQSATELHIEDYLDAKGLTAECVCVYNSRNTRC